MFTRTDYFLFLNYVFHDSPNRIHEARRRFESIDQFHAGFSDWDKAGYFQKRVKEFDLDRYKARLSQAQIDVITVEDPRYPDNLSQIYDPPVVLFAKGDVSLLKKPILSVIGSREHSVYGVCAAQMMVQELAPFFIIASGMARGLDTVAHTKALDLGQPTIAVMPTGINFPYPTQNRKLYDRIIQQGLVISEQPLDVPALPYRFPLRNRIISGISEGVLVVEAGERSGAIITANLAMEQGRNVYAIPGPITSIYSLGTHRLIQDGAKLVHEAKDITIDFQSQELPFEKPKVPAMDLSNDEEKIVTLLAQNALSADELAPQLGMDLSLLLQTLTLLEIKNVIEQVSGNYCLK